MIYNVDIWSYSISEWSFFYTKHKSLFISQVVKWLDAFVALQNINGKSLLYMSDGYLYKRNKGISNQ